MNHTEVLERTETMIRDVDNHTIPLEALFMGCENGSAVQSEIYLAISNQVAYRARLNNIRLLAARPARHEEAGR